MKIKKLREMVIEAIVKRGATAVPSRTRKYMTFSRPADEQFYFVGHNGALRVGRSASNSISLERGAFYKSILDAYHDQLKAPTYDESTNPSNGWRAPEMTAEEIADATNAGYDRYARGGN